MLKPHLHERFFLVKEKLLVQIALLLTMTKTLLIGWRQQKIKGAVALVLPMNGHQLLPYDVALQVAGRMLHHAMRNCVTEILESTSCKQSLQLLACLRDSKTIGFISKEILGGSCRSQLITMCRSMNRLVSFFFFEMDWKHVDVTKGLVSKEIN